MESRAPKNKFRMGKKWSLCLLFLRNTNKSFSLFSIIIWVNLKSDPNEGYECVEVYLHKCHDSQCVLRIDWAWQHNECLSYQFSLIAYLWIQFEFFSKYNVYCSIHEEKTIHKRWNKLREKNVARVWARKTKKKHQNAAKNIWNMCAMWHEASTKRNPNVKCEEIYRKSL